MKKFLTILLVATLLFCLTFTISYAEAGVEGESADTEIANPAETDSDTPLAEEAKIDTNIFDTLYSVIMKNADKILSALAFAASLVLAFCYKSGFLPLMNSALGKISDKISELTKNAEESAASANELSISATEKLTEAKDAIDGVRQNLTNLEERLAACATEEERVKNVYTVLLTQVDMLTEIFMSSSLPAYQKDKVSEKIHEMKKSLGTGEVENEK